MPTQFLEALLSVLPDFKLMGDGRTQITSITDDSRRVHPGALFVAVRGLSTDGHHYIEDAVRRGAAAIVAEEVPGKISICSPLAPSVSEFHPPLAPPLQGGGRGG